MARLESNLVLSLIDRVSGPARGITGTMRRLRAAGDELNGSNRRIAASVASGVGRVLAWGAAFVSVTAAVKGTVGAAMSLEDAMADVKKVINFDSPEQFKQIRKDIIDLSRDIPRTAEGFAQIYAAAGQSGIATRELKGFATMAAQVATAWDVSDQAAGSALAELKTALGRSVAGVGLLADAINHLGNNSAASSPKILDYEQRVASLAETAGFSAEEAAAFGAAMIGSGFESEVAATSFTNMAKALTAGEAATKSQRTALGALGLKSRDVAKRMQKDAVGTTLDVIERIGKLPAYRQGAVAQLLFGSEARALTTIIRDTKELRRDLGLISDETKYAGSAQREYQSAADRTSASLQRMWNNIRAWATGIGDRFLPVVRTLADEVSDVFRTLDDRVTIFDRIEQRVKGFMRGLGFEDGSSVVEAFKAGWDAIFGRVDQGIEDSERLARAFEKWRQAGAAVRAFGDDVKAAAASFERFLGLDAGAVGRLLGEVSGWGGTLIVGAVGFSLVSGAVGALARALYTLTGIKLAVGTLRWLGRLAGLGRRAGEIERVAVATRKVAEATERVAQAGKNLPKPGALFSLKDQETGATSRANVAAGRRMADIAKEQAAATDRVFQRHVGAGMSQAGKTAAETGAGGGWFPKGFWRGVGSGLGKGLALAGAEWAGKQAITAGLPAPEGYEDAVQRELDKSMLERLRTIYDLLFGDAEQARKLEGAVREGTGATRDELKPVQSSLGSILDVLREGIGAPRSNMPAWLGGSGGGSGPGSGGYAGSPAQGAEGARSMAPGAATSASARQLYDAYRADGWSHAQAVALLGHNQQESGLRGSAWNAGEGAGGIIQWRGARLANLKRFAARSGAEWTDPVTQAHFVRWEMENDPYERRRSARFRSSTTVAGASSALRSYVRFGDQTAPQRLAYAREFDKQLAAAPARAGGGPVTGGRLYQVGERGREGFVPGVSGTIFASPVLRNFERLRRAATGGALAASLASATALPAAAAPADLAGAPRGLAAAPAQGPARAVTVDVGGITIHVAAAPGQSAEAIADIVERRLAASLSSLSRAAFSDGAY
ncbi:phage tail tape measure protein [Aurantimonas sp. MSK8Z-1]|uniref:phage tail tape measure protein n=1 Tax=Mangrovibrevibacter kandeliae TaxID=2968473 RepID=UPI002117B06A|nr:phage tail tape measure protein [Aurantimonas sp. MSK8Z-1]MCW4114732.1 phage tail tape measure protein [Aurantimonas sp. MSK8Z-1]